MALGYTYYPPFIPAPGNASRYSAQHTQLNDQRQRSEARQSPSSDQAHSSPGSNSSRTGAPRSILRTGVSTNTVNQVASSSEHRYHNNLAYMYRPRPIPANSATAPIDISPRRDAYHDTTSLPGTSSSAGSYHALSPTALTSNAPDVSRRYPDLHFMLASDSTRISYDVRQLPSQGIDPALYEAYRHLWASREPIKHMRLISYDFPWAFDIRIAPPTADAPVAPSARTGSAGSAESSSPTTGIRRRARFDIPEPEEEPDDRGVQLGHIWDVLYHYLYEPIQPAEWAAMAQMLAADEARTWRRAMERYAERRRFDEGGEKLVIRRIDWLGRRCIFRGLEKDDEYAKLLLLPGEEECSETWIVKFMDVTPR